MTDEIEYNPFFKALQEDFSVVYEKAQSECCTICIPQTTSLPKSKVSLDFVEMHILSPSPYFRGQYVNWNKSRAEFEIDEDLITAIKGFQKPFSVRILSEELAYNKKYEPFKILILDHPLDPSLTSSLVSDTTESVSQPGKSSLEYCQFLQSKRHAQKALAQLDKEIVAFNKNYVIVEGYLDQTASRLETICKQSLQSICEAFQRDACRVDQRMLCDLQLAVECYLFSGVHDKVFYFVKRVHQEQDQEVLSLCRKCTGITAKALGVEQRLCCSSPEGVVELAALDTHTSPLDKLICMKETLEHITNSVKSSASKQHCLEVDGIPSLASDDLIPLLVVVIVQAKCDHLPSNLSYCEMFHWSTSSKAELGYTLVTFQAAVHYMQDADLSRCVPKESEEEVSSEISSQAAEIAARSQGKVVRSSTKTQEPKRNDEKTKMPSSLASDSISSKPSPIAAMKFASRYSARNQRNIISPDEISLNQSENELGGILGALQGRKWADGTSGRLS